MPRWLENLVLLVARLIKERRTEADIAAHRAHVGAPQTE